MSLISLAQNTRFCTHASSARISNVPRLLPAYSPRLLLALFLLVHLSESITSELNFCVS